ncbi:MAG: GNAT family N-acetyltransferase [Gammaproteobacteria bacterium]|nr:GNAT family N-acetyltransferase [Gammaproteobacteria bacterium]
MDHVWRTAPFDALSTLELYAIMRLRMQVFVVEQQSIYLDLDNKDLQALHILCHAQGRLCAYQRCLPPGVSYDQSSLGRIVVHPAFRGAQLGRDLVERGIACNREHWPDADICISAQAHLQGFYSSLGFVAQGDEYQEDGIAHRKMLLRFQ